MLWFSWDFPVSTNRAFFLKGEIGLVRYGLIFLIGGDFGDLDTDAFELDDLTFVEEPLELILLENMMMLKYQDTLRKMFPNVPNMCTKYRT